MVSSAMAGGTTFFEGYQTYKVFANDAGVINEDINKIIELMDSLISTDENQEITKIIKTWKTKDKNIVQRLVEDFVTKLSGVGENVF